MTIRPPGIRLISTTNRTSQLSHITYHGAIALGFDSFGALVVFPLRNGVELVVVTASAEDRDGRKGTHRRGGHVVVVEHLREAVVSKRQP
jgi:hypothetical protein